MSRSIKEPVVGAIRKSPPGLFPNGSLRNFKEDENLDLFSKARRPFSVSSAQQADASLKLGRLSIGSAKQGRTGLDDLFSPDGGKHDYDWLLTPPGTPLVPSSNGNESQQGLLAPRSSPLVRSVSTTKASRLSVSQSESNHAAKPARSRSVTRSSVSSSQHVSYSNKSTSILNSSSASVSSYIRPSTPTNRSSGTARPSTSSARPSVSRSATPSKSRTAPAPPASSVDKPRPSQSSRPSTPTSRAQVSTNTISSTTLTTSRSSTPTRRNSAPSLSLVPGALVPGVHNHTNGRNVASLSRPSSPASRVRPPPQAIVLSAFPVETPPNLRTTLTERSISAGRSRPGTAAAAKGNVEPLTTTVTAPRRQPSPVVTKGRAADPIARGRPLVNGQLSNSMDNRRELSTRKPVSTSTDGTGFGRTISKKTPDTARHMDIKNSCSLSRPVTGSTLFPQSIRSSNHKPQHGVASGNAENGNHINSFSESGSEEEKHSSSAKLANSDIYESSRYEMILLKEDLKNMSWLHSIDDKSDEGSIFDNGFERLPEPFDQE